MEEMVRFLFALGADVLFRAEFSLALGAAKLPIKNSISHLPGPARRGRGQSFALIG